MLHVKKTVVKILIAITSGKKRSSEKKKKNLPGIECLLIHLICVFRNTCANHHVQMHCQTGIKSWLNSNGFLQLTAKKINDSKTYQLQYCSKMWRYS